MAQETVEGFINIGTDLSDVKEQKVMKAGLYSLVIASAKGVMGIVDEQKVVERLQIVIDFEGDPDAASMFQNLYLPHGNDEPKAAQFKAIQLKRFNTLFGINPFQDGQLNLSSYAGARKDNVSVDKTYYNKDIKKEATEDQISQMRPEEAEFYMASNRIKIPKLPTEE